MALSAVKELHASAMIGDETLVAAEGDEQWRPFREYNETSSLMLTPTPPVPSPIGALPSTLAGEERKEIVYRERASYKLSSRHYAWHLFDLFAHRFC